MNNNLPTTFNAPASPANANHAVITVRGLSKRYVMHERRMSLRQEAGQIARRWLHGDTPRPDEDYYWALRNVSFDVFSGERVAIIGRNGAGKTTLLRALSGITAPTEGTISVRGKAVALIGLGAGFDTARTGRENIFLNAAIYGVMPGETRALVDAIIDFSELKDFIDTPVKRYSSGMVARLGFSIAIHILPDIVMLDEVLSVGDVAFQEKCVARIRELRARSSTVLFVSHSIKAAADLCERAIWLHRGALMMDGATDAVIEAYREMLRQSAEA